MWWISLGIFKNGKLKGEVDWALELLEEGLNSLGWKGLII